MCPLHLCARKGPARNCATKSNIRLQTQHVGAAHEWYQVCLGLRYLRSSRLTGDMPGVRHLLRHDFFSRIKVDMMPCPLNVHKPNRQCKPCLDTAGAAHVAFHLRPPSPDKGEAVSQKQQANKHTLDAAQQINWQSPAWIWL